LNIEIIPAGRNLIPVMHQLACLYRYDLSEFANWPVPVDGNYVYQGLEAYWGEGYTPLLLKVNDELAGFVILAHDGKSEDVDFECLEFFVMRKFRGQGVGKHIATKLFSQYRGQWLIKQLIANKPAIAFWSKTLSAHTCNTYDRSTEVDPEFGEVKVLRFCNS
jgi:predicted acetyltransferase